MRKRLYFFRIATLNKKEDKILFALTLYGQSGFL